jgi:hypothetical protein
VGIVRQQSASASHNSRELLDVVFSMQPMLVLYNKNEDSHEKVMRQLPADKRHKH